MSADFAQQTIEVGQTFSPDTLTDPNLMTTLVEIFGFNLPKDLALIVIAAGFFFIGVIIASLLPKEIGFARRNTIISAPLSFLLTAPVWFSLLRGDVLSTNISAIDSFLQWAMGGGDGSGDASGQMFAFGVVMLLGVLSWPILKMFKGVVQFILDKFAKKTPTTDPTTAASTE